MKIILFDGVCNLCNSSVDFILKHDRNNVFKFASQQSEIGQNFLKEKKQMHNELGTIVLIDENEIYTKSSAVLKILSYLKGYPKLLSILKILPKSITDFFYDKIAQNRYKLFGKRDTCRLPTEEEKSKFL